MSLDTCKFITGIALILKKDNKVLLHKRNIPGKIAFGNFAFPGGAIENNETIKYAACREAEEELGIKIEEKNINIVHFLRLREKHDPATQTTQQILMLYFAEVTTWTGEPQNLEPEKHSDLSWHDIHDMPQNFFTLNKQAVTHINNKVFYSEYGWE